MTGSDSDFAIVLAKRRSDRNPRRRSRMGRPRRERGQGSVAAARPGHDRLLPPGQGGRRTKIPQVPACIPIPLRRTGPTQAGDGEGQAGRTQSSHSHQGPARDGIATQAPVATVRIPEVSRLVLRPNGWYADLSYAAEKEPVPPSAEAIAMDLGVNNRIALSKGEMVERR